VRASHHEIGDAAGESVRESRCTLRKAPTGIQGLDDVTQGGLPQGRPTLVCGGPGSGKTLLAVEFLVHGAIEHHEPGVMMAFEETSEELALNVASLGFRLNDLISQKKLLIDYVRVERSEIRETGEYNLEGLFVRLGMAIDEIGAKRVVMDSLEMLFAGLTNTAILRAEFRRLFRWLKDRGVTAIVTAERGEGTLTRYGLEEYLSDCVILLDHRVNNQNATRRLRVVKYRGSSHGCDEYPFLIGEQGLSVLPISSVELGHIAPTERISSGVPRLDMMLGGAGYYRGSSVLVSGTAGTGKTSLSAHLVDSTCRNGQRCLMFLFEESPSQLVRNLRSIGIDLERWIQQGLLHIHAARPTLYGLEKHLLAMHKLTREFQPQVVVMDPVTNLTASGTASEVRSLLTRLIDFFKNNQITTFFTSLTSGSQAEESTDVGISSLMDTWLLLRDTENNGERNRVLYVLKSRGMAHSNQVREFRLTGSGIDLVDVYVGPGGVLTGTARLAQEARERSEALLTVERFDRNKRDLERKQKLLKAQLEALIFQLEDAEGERRKIDEEEHKRQAAQVTDREEMARARYADTTIEVC
jgi:circadian clock protein KaiC